MSVPVDRLGHRPLDYGPMTVNGKLPFIQKSTVEGNFVYIKRDGNSHQYCVISSCPLGPCWILAIGINVDCGSYEDTCMLSVLDLV